MVAAASLLLDAQSMLTKCESEDGLDKITMVSLKGMETKAFKAMEGLSEDAFFPVSCRRTCTREAFLPSAVSTHLLSECTPLADMTKEYVLTQLCSPMWHGARSYFQPWMLAY